MEKPKFTTLLLTTLLLTNLLSGQNISKNILPGSWLGKLSVQSIELRLVYNFKLNEKDSLIATLDSPDQGAKNIPLGSVIMEDKKLTIKAPVLSGEYNGTITSDTTIEGVWTQRGVNYTVNLKKLKIRSEERRVGKECRS